MPREVVTAACVATAISFATIFVWYAKFVSRVEFAVGSAGFVDGKAALR